MKAVLYDAPRSFASTKAPIPEAAAGEIRIKVDQVGVCGPICTSTKVTSRPCSR